MKVYVISDIHGSYEYLEKFFKIYDECMETKMLVILGDVLYHGPRNNLPKGYDPKSVSELLNKYSKDILLIKGNCDSEVDQMLLKPRFVEEGALVINGKKIYLSHGHKYDLNNLPFNNGDTLIIGHYHVNYIKDVNGVTLVNPGSLSLPKENSKNSFMIIDEEMMKIYSLEDNEVIFRKEMR